MYTSGALLIAQLVKNLPACRRPWFNSWVGKIPWGRDRLPTPVFWPGEFHGLYSPWGHKESETTKRLSLLLSAPTFKLVTNKAKCLLPDFRYSLHEVKVKVTQSCLTLCNPMDYIVHGLLQARILEWVAIPFSRGSS